ncbi:hypothetical protein OAK49_03250 [Euryarchaeota archaeon]|nr:hypothetical protein [Euryarchaeota archaeon]
MRLDESNAQLQATFAPRCIRYSPYGLVLLFPLETYFTNEIIFRATKWATTSFKFPIRKRVVARPAFFYPLYKSLAFAVFTFFNFFNFLTIIAERRGPLNTHETLSYCVIHGLYRFIA